MANTKVKVKLRIKLLNGTRVYRDPVYEKNKLKRFYASIDGVEEEHREGVYTLFFYEGNQLCRKHLKDSSVQGVAAALQKQEIALQAIAQGLIKSEAGLDTVRRSTQAVIDKYLLDNEGKADETHGAYRVVLAEFTASCNKKYLGQIDREDWLAFIKFLKAKGHAPRTVSNKIGYLITFYNSCGLPIPLQKNDRSLFKYTEKKAKAYNEKTIIEFFSKLTIDENDLFQTFLCTGFRDGEVQHIYWSDFDFDDRTARVSEKRELKFKPKDSEERVIPIPPSLVELLRARRERYPEGRLVFPAKRGGVDTHFLRLIKNIAFKNGLNCGQCPTKSGTCKDHPVCERWQLHRFRKTFATLCHQNGVPVATIQKWLGHADIETTLRYLADVDDHGEKTQARVSSTFAFVNGPR
jgi:integrase